MSERIAKIELDQRATPRSKEAVHERNVAIADLLDENRFEPKCMQDGPYDIVLGVSDGRLVLDVNSVNGKTSRVLLSIAPLRGIIRDYFMICESYYDALKDASCGKIEAIDMGRRGIHNEGSELLQEVLKDRIVVDFPTARRLFTLICVLHLK
jgi:uncharacterized protein (UPF0262 family)